MPTVSIICICYNHENYVVECLKSVFNQTYEDIQLIIVDNKSSDESVSNINQVISKKDGVTFLEMDKNMGHCKAFNLAYKHVIGKYIIDLSADDVLLPERVSRQVAIFEKLDQPYGVVFSDAYLIDENSQKIKTYYRRSSEGQLIEKVPSGDVYINLIEKSFISAPTMMIRKTLLDHLGGYDENLSYEDFDFWVRSGRESYYYFQDEILTKKRELNFSSKSLFYTRNENTHLESTLIVCRKALLLNINKLEDAALGVSVRYHMRLSFYTENFYLVDQYANLLQSISPFLFVDRLIIWCSKKKIKVNFMYKFYLRMIK